LAAALVPLPTGSRPAAVAAPGARAGKPPTSAVPASAVAASFDALAPQLVAAAAVNAVPRNLSPSLSRAHGDKARPFVDGCFDDFTDATVRCCHYADKSSSRRLVLFGDSHAVQWFPAAEEVARRRSWDLAVLAKATCPPIDVRVFSPNLGRDYDECSSWRRG